MSYVYNNNDINISGLNNCKTIFENINDIIKLEGYNNEFLSVLEKAVLSNDKEYVIEQLNSGNTIYYENLLCCGLYQKKFNYHPSQCHDIVCKKTAMYYALWMNVLLYSRILINLIEILDNSPCLHFRMNNKEKNNDKILIKISNKIKNIYLSILNLDDSLCLINKFEDFYTEKSMNFNKIYDLFKNNLDELVKLFVERYGTNNINFSLEKNMVSWKNNIKNLYIYENVDKTIDHIKQVNLVSYLELNYKEYLKNVEICKLMFNQQSYEYYVYNLKNSSYQISSILEHIKSNNNIDLNYENMNNNILSYTLKHTDNKDLVYNLFKSNLILPKYFSIKDIIQLKHYQNLKELLSNCDAKYLENISDLYEDILNLDNIRTSDKLEMIEILSNRKMLNFIDNLFDMTIEHELSFDIFEILSMRTNLKDKINIDNVRRCITLRKNRELNLLISLNSNLKKSTKFEDNILYIYENETNNDNEAGVLNLLDTIINNKINLEITNDEEKTIILLLINKRRTKSVEKLILSNANVFHKDNKGNNVLHYAIMNEDLRIINMLVLKTNNVGKNLVNESNNENEYGLHLLVKTKKPVEILKYLSSNSNTDYKIRDKNGDMLLHHILSQNISIDNKIDLFKNLIDKNLDLLENSKTDMKPIVIRSVERDIYEIVILVMNKLLELGEINVLDIDDEFDIENLIIEDKIGSNLIPKDKNSANFYSLVILYIKDSLKKCRYRQKKLSNLTNYLTIMIILAVTYHILRKYNYLIHYCIFKKIDIKEKQLI